MTQDFFTRPGESTTDLINQLEYMELKTDADKAKFAYALGYKAGFREAEKKYENVRVFTEDENSGLLDK